MSKKKEMKKIFENLDVESSEAHPEISGSSKDASTPETSETNEEMNLRAEMLAAEQEEPSAQPAGQEESTTNVDEEMNLRAEMLAAEAEGGSAPVSEALNVEQPAAEAGPPTAEAASGKEMEALGAEDKENPDDLLEDVRKSLLEEEAQEEEHPKWWRRIGRSSRRKKVDQEVPKAPEEINLPALGALQAADAAADAGETKEPDEYQEQLDALIDLLDQDEEPVEKDIALAPPEPEMTPEPEPEKPVDIEELKKQAFQPRPEQEENLTEVRTIALEGDEEAFVEVEARPQDPFAERLDAVENALKPYRRYINFGFAFLGLIMAILAAFVIFNVYQRSVVQNAPTEVPSNLPFPTSVSLPGGWQFTLGKGSLTAEGSWNPAGAEWLQGTEVCRWVALPWNRQLEAVIRTLNRDDTIELGMSNNDNLIYKVYTIEQLSPEEMRELDSNSPCLLIVLAEPDTEKRWVLTALP